MRANTSRAALSICSRRSPLVTAPLVGAVFFGFDFALGFSLLLFSSMSLSDFARVDPEPNVPRGGVALFPGGAVRFVARVFTGGVIPTLGGPPQERPRCSSSPEEPEAQRKMCVNLAGRHRPVAIPQDSGK